MTTARTQNCPPAVVRKRAWGIFGRDKLFVVLIDVTEEQVSQTAQGMGDYFTVLPIIVEWPKRKEGKK